MSELGAVLAVAANPDPSRHQLASAGTDATVKLWEVMVEEQERESLV
jgi:hypothetical protein